MIKGKTSSGFKFAIDERVKTDWRLIDAIASIDSGDITKQIAGMNSLADLILGERKDEFLEHIAKKNDGYAPIDIVSNELKEILQAEELKNS